MAKIRLGNDVYVSWTLKDSAGNAYNLTGRSIEVWLVCYGWSMKVTEYSVTGNVITFTFAGSDQVATGSYSLRLVENRGASSMVTHDVKEVFTLVNHSWDTTDTGISVSSLSVVSAVGGIVGPRGLTGNGISSAVLNPDYTLTLNFTDGTSYTTPSIRGPKGDDGADGSDADVTYQNVIAALGFTPASASALAGKQDTLESGVNIKTINGESILGEGDIEIQGGGSSEAVLYTEQSLTAEQKTQARTNIGAGTSSFSGSYNDLSNKPSIPDAQIQSDWNQSDNSTKDYIKNKPSIPAAQIQSDWNQSDDSKKDFIKNKPTIPTVPTISTDIASDADSDTKTASPKAVKSFVEGKGYGTYSKPSSGIPKTDLAQGVQDSLGLADSALQSHQDISGKENTSNKVTSFQTTPDDTHYPSEKLVKDSLDGKQPTIDNDHKLDYSLIANTPTETELTTQIIDALWAAAN